MDRAETQIISEILKANTKLGYYIIGECSEYQGQCEFCPHKSACDFTKSIYHAYIKFMEKGDSENA